VQAISVRAATGRAENKTRRIMPRSIGTGKIYAGHNCGTPSENATGGA
jgi:hypothetical protein